MRLCRVTTGVASLRRERMAIAKGGNRVPKVVIVSDNRPVLPKHYQCWHPRIVSLVDAILPLIPQIPKLSSSLCSHQHLRTASRPVPWLFFSQTLYL